MLERFKVPAKDRVYVPQEKVRAATEACSSTPGWMTRGLASPPMS